MKKNIWVYLDRIKKIGPLLEDPAIFSTRCSEDRFLERRRKKSNFIQRELRWYYKTKVEG